MTAALRRRPPARLRLRRRTARCCQSSVTPAWSVVIPTHNRKDTLERCLACLHRQDPARTPTFEVVVVDDASDDGTWSFLTSDEAAETFPNLRPVRRWQNGGASAARNDALRAARGEYVLFIDDDLWASPRLLESHADALRTNPRATVSLGVVVDTPDRAVAVDVPPLPHQGRSAAYFATGNCAVRADALRAVCAEGTPAAFDEDFTAYGWEDLELGTRLQASGATAVRPRAAYGYHYQPRACADAADASLLELCRSEQRALCEQAS